MSKKPNRLIHSRSPYLLQHAYNPVDWFEWGEEAFEKAKQENKIIFLSIGYSTCHWCHVMEKESFEDLETAKILNNHFVSIKVDREELPDVDAVYMQALHLMGQHGGWPLNMFLTPDRVPFFGGTYFPDKPKWGKPTFKQILLKIIDLWNREKEKILESANEIYQYLQNQRYYILDNYQIDFENFKKIINQYYEYFDGKKGGFLTNGNNKFPPSMAIIFLANFYKKEKMPIILEMIEKTIIEMRKGGIYDQLGGGISRYSTDHNWLVPHFEKMLYDNALFILASIEAYRISKKEIFKNIAKDTVEYLKRDLRHSEGGFFSAEDADSEGEEGKYYLWTRKEIIDILKENSFRKEEIEEVLRIWNIPDTGNTNKHFLGKNILYLNQIDDLNSQVLQKARKILLRYRLNRIQPSRDEKILVSWNALMISALSHTFLATGEEIYLQDALKTFDFIQKYLVAEKLNHKNPQTYFYRSYSNITKTYSPYSGTLSDHALMGSSLLDLYKATGNIEYLIYSKNILDYILSHFYEDQRFYETQKNENYLIIRPSDFYDGVIPSGVSATLRILVHHYFYGIDKSNVEKYIDQILRNYLYLAVQNPMAYTYFLCSIFKYFYSHQEIVVIVRDEKEKLDAIKNIGNYLSTESIFFLIDTENFEKNQKYNFSMSLIQDNIINQPGIFICENSRCQLPILNWADLEKEKIL